MNQDVIIEIARLAGARDDGNRFEFSEYKYLERFYQLAADYEREHCLERIDIAMLGADRGLRNAVFKAINTKPKGFE